MKTIINSNVERIIEDEMLEKYKALGYKEISSSKASFEFLTITFAE